MARLGLESSELDVAPGDRGLRFGPYGEDDGADPDREVARPDETVADVGVERRPAGGHGARGIEEVTGIERDQDGRPRPAAAPENVHPQHRSRVSGIPPPGQEGDRE